MTSSFNFCTAILLLPLFFAATAFVIKSNRVLVPWLISVFVINGLIISSLWLELQSNHGSYNYVIGSWPSEFGIALSCNNYSINLVAMIWLAASISMIYAIFSWKNYKTIPFILMASVGFMGMAFSADLFNLYVFTELSAIAVYIALANKTKSSYKAALEYLIIASLAGIIMLLGILLIYADSGHLNMLAASQSSSTRSFIGIIIMCFAFTLKAGVFPLHRWIINAYLETSPNVAGFLSGCAAKIYLFNVWKLLTPYSQTHFGTTIKYTILLILIVSALGFMFEVISSKNISKSLALSSISQNLYFFIAILSEKNIIILAIMLLWFGHTISTGLLFNNANHKINNLPALTVFILSNAAYPMTIGFIGKLMILQAALNPIIIFSLVIVSACSLLYSFYIIEDIYFSMPQIKFISIYYIFPILLLLLLAGFWLAGKFFSPVYNPFFAV